MDIDYIYNTFTKYAGIGITLVSFIGICMIDIMGYTPGNISNTELTSILFAIFALEGITVMIRGSDRLENETNKK